MNLETVEVLKTAGEMIAKGHKQTIVNFLDKLKNEVVLPEAMQAKLDEIGDNPIDEKELNDKLNSFDDPMDKIDLVDELLENPDQYSAKDLAVFMNKVEDKITSYQNEDGTYKTTKNTQDAKMLDRKGYKQIMKIISTDGRPTMTAEQQKEAHPVGLKLSGLDKKKLTEWEINLVGFMMVHSALDTWVHSVGKR